MGHLIGFGDRLEERAALGLGDGRPAFYFDLGCPFSYLAAERVERLLGEVDWIPVSGDAFSASSASKAEKRAACTNDVMQYCFSAIASMKKVESCLRAQKSRLSGTCKALFDKYEPTPGQPANSASR